MSGYCAKLLRIDLTTGKTTTEQIDPEAARKFVGGRGLGSHYLANEIDPGIDGLSPDNKLIFATGPLTGTTAPAPGRYMAITKSPLTGTVTDSHQGGWSAARLRWAGFDGLRAPVL